MPETKVGGREIFDRSVTHLDIDLSGTPAKTNPVAADYFVVVDSAAPTVLKMVSFTEASNFFIPYTGGVANVNLGVHNLTVDTNSLFVDSTYHRVGIGSAGSSHGKLTIDTTGSAASIAPLYLIGSGNYGSGLHSKIGNYLRASQASSGMHYLSWGMYHTGAAWVREYTSADKYLPYLEWSTGGTMAIGGTVSNLTTDTAPTLSPLITFDVTGRRVGIGTISPTGTAILHAAGNINIDGTYRLQWTAIAGRSISMDNDASHNALLSAYGNIDFQTYDDAVTSYSSKLMILKTGNVGIKTTTPLATLNVYGNTKIGVSTRTPYKTLDIAGHINFDQVPNPTSGQVTGMTLANGGAGNIPAGTYYYNVAFYTADGETGNTFYATIPTITLAGSSQVNISNIPISTDPRVIGRKIFRSQAGTLNDYYYVYEIGTIANNTATTWTDNTAINTTSGNWMYNKANTTAGLIYIENVKHSQLSTVVTAFGYGALGSLTRGSTTAAFGSSALTSCTSGDGNHAFGHSALYHVTTGSSNNAFGYASGNGNMTGQQNNSFGASALRNDSSLSYSFNVAIGTESLRSLLANNNYNTAVGHNSGRLAAGTGNTFLGATAGSLSVQTVTGSYNIAIGYGAGSNLAAGGYNVVLGYAVTIPTPANSNQLNIGNVIYATGLASGNTPSATGKTGFGIAAPTEVVHAYSANDSAMLFETATGRFAQYQLKSGATNKWIIGTQNNFNSNALLFRNGSTDLVVLTTTGNFGVGIAAPTSPLHIYRSKAYTAFSTEGVSNIYSDLQVSTTNTSVGIFTPIQANVYLSGSGSFSSAVSGFSGIVRSAATSTSQINGIDLLVTSNTVGTVSSLYGAKIEVGQITAGTITNLYGMRIDHTYTTGSIQHAYGVYVSSSAMTNYFAGSVGIGSVVPEGLLHVHMDVNNKFTLDNTGDYFSLSFLSSDTSGNGFGSMQIVANPEEGVNISQSNGSGSNSMVLTTGFLALTSTAGTTYIQETVNNHSIIRIGDADDAYSMTKLVIDDDSQVVHVTGSFGVGITTPHEAIEVVGNIRASRIDSTYNATHVRVESKMGTGYSSAPASYDFYALGIGTNDAILSGDVLGRIKAIGMTSGAGLQDGPYIDFRAKADWTGSTYVGHNSEIAFFAPSAHGLAAMVVNYRGVEINPDLADVNFAINGDTYSNVFCMKASVDSVGLMTNNPTSLLHVMGSIATRVVTLSVTGGYTLGTLDATLVVTYNGASSTITLPTAADCEGRIYVVKNFTGNIGGQDVIISRSGTDQIMTSSLENSITITNGKTALFQSAGSGKWIHLGTIQK